MSERTGDGLLSALAKDETAVLPLVDWLLEQDDPLGDLSRLEARVQMVRAEVVIRMGGHSTDSVLSIPIKEIFRFFKVRIKKAILRMRIRTLGELIQKSPSDFLYCRDFGQGSLWELRRFLWEKYQLKLKDDPDLIPEGWR